MTGGNASGTGGGIASGAGGGLSGAGGATGDDATAGGTGGTIVSGTDAAPVVDARLDASSFDGGSAACAVLADAACAKLQACSAFAVGALYGDVIHCKERLALTCLPTFDGPGTSATPANTVACAQSLSALPCEMLSLGNLGTACAPQPGALATGAACGDDAQCSSAFCARASDAICGVCAAATRAGDACVRGACSTGTVCPAGRTTCIAPVAGQVGDACAVQEECDVAHAIGCDTLNRRCIRLTLATSTCGANSLINPTTFALCPASGTCSALLNGTCAPAAADGATCNTTSGPACLSPARCVAGTCVLPAPATCR